MNKVVTKILFSYSKIIIEYFVYSQGQDYKPPQQPQPYVPPGFPPAQQGPMAYGGGYGPPGQGQPPIVTQPQMGGDGEYLSAV